MRITVSSDHGRVSFRDDTATVGDTTLNDMFAAIADLMQTLAGEPGEESVVLPFGFSGAEVAPEPDDLD